MVTESDSKLPRRKSELPHRGPPGEENKPSIRDVALLAGVGLGTASRVINGHPNVREEKRKRVRAAIAQLGYAPDIVAQSMRNHRSMTFACIMRDFTVPVLSMFVDSMQKEIDPFGFSLMVASSYHDPEREMELLRGFQQRRIDGLVVATSSEKDPTLLALLNEAQFPIVLLDRRHPNGLDAVSVNHAAGISQAVFHLMDMGHRRIAIISGEPGLHPTQNRLEGYLEAHRVREVPVDQALIRMVSFGRDAANAQARSLLEQPMPPTAIIAGGTSLLPAVMQAARECELVIPRDLSVIAGADSDLAMLSTPSITVVRWSHDQLGKAAARFLISRLGDAGLPPQRLAVDAELVVRESCAPPKK